MRTITASFATRSDAERAGNRLADAGIDTRQLAFHDADETPGWRRSGSGISERGGVHRNILGDYIDEHSGKRLAEGAGSRRTSLGDYSDGATERRPDEGARSRRNALGDFIDIDTGRRIGDGAGSKRNALGDFIDSRTGHRIGEDAGSRRNAIGDFIDTDTGRRIGDGAGSKRNALGDFIDSRTGHRIGEGAGSRRNALGDFIEPATGQRVAVDAGSLPTATGRSFGDEPSNSNAPKSPDHGHSPDSGADHAARPCVLSLRVAEPDIDRAIALLENGEAGASRTDVSSWRAEGWRPLPSIAMADFSRRGDTQTSSGSADRAAAGLNDGAVIDNRDPVGAAGNNMPVSSMGRHALTETQA